MKVRCLSMGELFRVEIDSHGSWHRDPILTLERSGLEPKNLLIRSGIFTESVKHHLQRIHVMCKEIFIERRGSKWQTYNCFVLISQTLDVSFIEIDIWHYWIGRLSLWRGKLVKALGTKDLQSLQQNTSLRLCNCNQSFQAQHVFSMVTRKESSV